MWDGGWGMGGMAYIKGKKSLREHRHGKGKGKRKEKKKEAREKKKKKDLLEDGGKALSRGASNWLCGSFSECWQSLPGFPFCTRVQYSRTRLQGSNLTAVLPVGRIGATKCKI